MFVSYYFICTCHASIKEPSIVRHTLKSQSTSLEGYTEQTQTYTHTHIEACNRLLVQCTLYNQPPPIKKGAKKKLFENTGQVLTTSGQFTACLRVHKPTIKAKQTQVFCVTVSSSLKKNDIIGTRKRKDAICFYPLR